MDAASSSVGNDLQVPLWSCTSWDDGNFAFHYQLPEKHLALHSAAIVNGVPELRFKASAGVPTIQEAEIATICRLVLEKKRPEFFYISFPPTHPMHQCRFYKQYRPSWLQGTAVGELLADADWKMKCLSIGTRSNDEKSVFKSWLAESHLKNLATQVNFPVDKVSGPIIMSCEHTKMQKGENEIVFPEEPKMQIKADTSSAYSEYVTEIYDSVAYYDEPNFLKIRELIKLIVAVEWLYKEKGVRLNKEWILSHTSAETKVGTLPNREKPPERMIPKPVSLFKRPSSDVMEKSWDVALYKKHQAKRHREYGYFDFSSSQEIKFKEDGTQCPTLQCLKLHTEECLNVSQFPIAERKQWFYLPMLPIFEQALSEIKKPPDSDPKTSVISPLSEAVDAKVEEDEEDRLPVTVDTKVMENGVEVKITDAAESCSPLSLTRVLTVSTDNSDEHFTGEPPNMLIRPDIPGVCEAVVPKVKSWDELINVATVPIPHLWLDNIRVPVAMGGVTARDFSVREERLQKKTVTEERREWSGSYSRIGPVLALRAEHIRIQGTFRLVSRGCIEFSTVSDLFSVTWEKNSCPSISFVFAITNTYLKQKWDAYRQKPNCWDYEDHYHGTSLSCNITSLQTPCNKGECGICGISCSGLDPQSIRRNISFQRFGNGFYLAPNSSKCHEYTKGANGFRAMLQCYVLPGKKYNRDKNGQSLNGPPPGYNSVYGKVGTKLNYPEIVVYNPDAVLPRYIIIYKKDGTDRLV